MDIILLMQKGTTYRAVIKKLTTKHGLTPAKAREKFNAVVRNTGRRDGFKIVHTIAKTKGSDYYKLYS